MVCFPEIATTDGGPQDVVGLVVRDRPQGWSVEFIPLHGPIVVISEVIYSGKCTFLVVTYSLSCDVINPEFHSP